MSASASIVMGFYKRKASTHHGYFFLAWFHLNGHNQFFRVKGEHVKKG